MATYLFPPPLLSRAVYETQPRTAAVSGEPDLVNVSWDTYAMFSIYMEAIAQVTQDTLHAPLCR